jgi:hypothetical protein
MDVRWWPYSASNGTSMNLTSRGPAVSARPAVPFPPKGVNETSTRPIRPDALDKVS